LTIPATPENEVLIERYCRKNDKILIPHFKTKTTVTGKKLDPISNQIKFFPVEKLAWVIYFSAWPHKLSYEHQDRLRAFCEIQPIHENRCEIIVHPHPKPDQAALRLKK
jgi:hypothetical protein